MPAGLSESPDCHRAPPQGSFDHVAFEHLLEKSVQGGGHNAFGMLHPQVTLGKMSSHFSDSGKDLFLVRLKLSRIGYVFLKLSRKWVQAQPLSQLRLCSPATPTPGTSSKQWDSSQVQLMSITCQASAACQARTC